MAALSAAALAVILVGALAIGGVFGSSSKSPKVTPKPPKDHTHAALGGDHQDLRELETRGQLRLPRELAGPLTDRAPPPTSGSARARRETRCALEIERGAGPANSGSQQAQLAFVRGRSAFAARTVKNYRVRAIQAEQGANIAGVGLIRVANGQGGHLGFFFKGRDVYIFDCITPAASLDQIDRQAFVPLLASVRIG